MEEPGGLQSRATQRARPNWATEYSYIIKHSAQTFLVCNVAEFVGISETFTLGRIKSFLTAAMNLKDAYSLEEKLWPT